MSRRTFLEGLAGIAASGLLACGGRAPSRPAAPAPRRAIAGVAFDLFTVFDPRSVDARVEAWAPGRGARLSLAWRTRAFEHAWIRAAAGRYAPFDEVLAGALAATARAEGLDLPAHAGREIVDGFSELDPWPDSGESLDALRSAGLRLTTLANFTPAMIASLVDRARLRPSFDHLVSTDVARTYKPDPRAYALGAAALGLPREAVAFSAFGGWDAVGAAWFGYPTFWVNRLGAPSERLDVEPVTGPDLRALVAWVGARA